MPQHKELWLLRHGDAEAGDGDDAARRLTERGERQARDAGSALTALGLRFVEVLTSPRVRARDTARLAAGPLGIEPVDHGPLSGGFEAEAALTVMAGHEPGAKVLMVGHEPDLSHAIEAATGTRVQLKKGGLAAIEGGNLIVLLGSGQLRAIASPR